MSPLAVVGWVLTVTPALRLSQREPLADLVEAAVRVGRGTLSARGRCLRGTAAKHAIKRVWRFCDNDAAHPTGAMAGVLRRVLRKRKRVLPVALDWTDARGFHAPMAGAVLKGRAIPLPWSSYTDGRLTRSRNTFEEGLLRLPVTLLPAGVKVVRLAGRGSGRAELAKTCAELRTRYLIRIKPDVRVAHPTYTGRPDEYPIKRGVWRVLAGAEYRSDKAVTLNVVIRWRHGLPARRDEPWLLVTDLPGHAVQRTNLYARRMAVEERFRDGKCGRYGLGLGRTQVTTTARLDRLILALAPALILLTGLGRVARRRSTPRDWGSRNDPRECSDVTVGRRMWERIDELPGTPIDHVVRASLTWAANWG